MSVARLPLSTVDDPALLLDDPDDITPAWIGSVLREGGLDVRVRTVRHEPIGTGQVAASRRVHLGYEGPVPPGAPSSVIAKFAVGDLERRGRASRAFVSEVGFYQHLAARSRARIPHCWCSRISGDHLRFTLLLEDLAPAVPGVQEAGCTLPQARDALANLAALHASFWNDTFLATGLDWIAPVDAEIGALLGGVLQSAVGDFTGRYAAALSPEDAETLAAAAAATERWSVHHQTPYSLIHGDYRLDNLMFPPTGRGVTALDWQGVFVGHPGRDVAYFLGCSLPPQTRRLHERSLVEEYHAALVRQGVTGFSPDDCFTGYRVGMLQGPLITVLGCVFSPVEHTPEADAMFLSMAARTCQAIRDLKTLNALNQA